MFRLAELFVEISARTGGLNGVLSGLHARLLGMGSLGKIASAGIHQLTVGFGALQGAIGSVGIAVGVGLAGAAVVGLAHCAMEAAHLQEAVAKVEQAFGSATPKVLGMADELAKKFGVINKEILDTAASFGLMLQGSGITRELSADMSVALSKIAVDAASYFDVSMQEAIQRMQSGLSGEMEAVRRWGVNLSETNIKRQAVAAGWSGKGELDQNTKTLIRYKLLMEGLKAAEGDAERSQGRLVGQWKLFQGELYQLATTVGAVAIPIFTGLLHVLNATLGAIDALISGIVNLGKSIIAGVGGWLGMDVFGEDDTAKRRADIDARIAQTEADRKADEDAARANEAKAKADKEADKKKGWQGGLEEFARHIQEGAWEKKKVDLGQQQLDQTKITNELLRKIGVGPLAGAGPAAGAAGAGAGGAPAGPGIAPVPNPAAAAPVAMPAPPIAAPAPAPAPPMPAAPVMMPAGGAGGGPAPKPVPPAGPASDVIQSGGFLDLSGAVDGVLRAIGGVFGARESSPPDRSARIEQIAVEQTAELKRANSLLEKILSKQALPVVT